MPNLLRIPFEKLIRAMRSPRKTVSEQMTPEELLAARLYKTNYGPIQAQVRPDQKAAIARRFYDHEGYNEYMTLDDVVRNLTNITNRELTIKDPIFRTQMLSPDERLRLYNGAPVKGEGFGSFSFNPDVAMSFAGSPMNNSGKFPTLFMINPGHKVKGQVLGNIDTIATKKVGASMPNEEEVLLGPRQGFRQRAFLDTHGFDDIPPEFENYIVRLHPDEDTKLLEHAVRGYRQGGLVQMKECGCG